MKKQKNAKKHQMLLRRRRSQVLLSRQLSDKDSRQGTEVAWRGGDGHREENDMKRTQGKRPVDEETE